MASDDLVSVGQVFEIFSGNVLGIKVEDRSFGSGNKLYCFDPKNPDEPIIVHAETVEIDRQRTRRVDPGDQCGVRPPQSCSNLPPIGAKVFVSKGQAYGAQQRTKKLHPRPKPSHYRNKKGNNGHRRRVW